MNMAKATTKKKTAKAKPEPVDPLKNSGLRAYHTLRRNFVDPVHLNKNLPTIGEVQKNRCYKDFDEFVIGETHLLAGFTGSELSKKIGRAIARNKKQFVQRKLLLVCNGSKEVGEAYMVKRVK
jgi:hypothetical protein